MTGILCRLRTYLEMTGKAYRFASPNEPFRRVILIPLDGVTIIHGELVVEVVVTFANGGKSGDNMVTRGMLVVERAVSEPVRQRIHTESRLDKNISAWETKCRLVARRTW